MDTGVCATEARKFNEEAAKLDHVEVIIVSMDLPFANERFCATEGIENLKQHLILSKSFLQNLMVYYKQMDHCLDLQQRAVFIINPSGKLHTKRLFLKLQLNQTIMQF